VSVWYASGLDIMILSISCETVRYLLGSAGISHKWCLGLEFKTSLVPLRFDICVVLLQVTSNDQAIPVKIPYDSLSY
jgi:hypothetical protein